jgi:23S rRNA (adenine1618-N6)-methyltransferase
VKPNAKISALKDGLHPRNRHRAGYDFAAMVRSCGELAPFLKQSPGGSATIDFADPAAVTALNRALLRHHYGVARWDLPAGYLCPPVPGRAEYLHHLADLLGGGGASPVPSGRGVRVLDIGVGANCIYPIIGVREYGWRFVGTDIDPVAVAWARQLVASNPNLAGHVELRVQPAIDAVFANVVSPGETFSASICNPPFHASAEEAAAGTLRKVRNLTGRTPARPVLNFGGQAAELWCEGGEAGFVTRMIRESAARPEICRWFTTLVAKRSNLPAIHRALQAAKVADVRTIELNHGQKKSRIVAWTWGRAALRR